MLTRGSLVAGLTLVLAVTSIGCASSSGGSGKVRMSSTKMCNAHGGEYNAITKKCQYPASTRTAQQTCEAHGGYYDTAADVCEIGRE